jgi:hypothetical protein
VFSAHDQTALLAAAEATAAELMAAPSAHVGRWEPTIAEYEPGVIPTRAAAVPE